EEEDGEGGAALTGKARHSQYVRPLEARNSYLIWKVFGRRLDGRTNETREDDMDFEGGPCPPPEAVTKGTVRPLSNEDRRTLVRWTDTGAAIQVMGHPPDPEAAGDSPFRDHLRPTLSIRPHPENSDGLPRRIVLGVFDLDSGIDPKSLAVRVAGPGGEALATDLAKIDNGRLEVPLPSGRETLELVVEVADRAGNRTTRQVIYRRRINR
ncbi:MAG: hypothetical protein HY720_13635, partial [Planctomycetes bacterium]|nr:hypothetical protein [Planctomycetota bacterium]